MILSNTRILEALDKRWLVITPEPAPRGLVAGVPCPYQASAVDLRLGPEISSFKKEELAMAIDLSQGNFASVFGAHSETLTISYAQPYHLRPGTFIHGKTLEQVELPILKNGPCFAARIEGRSSYARCGMLVHFTAPTIHAGYANRITLEIINLGPHTILLHPGDRICQLIIERVDGVPFRNDSQFQGQPTVREEDGVGTRARISSKRKAARAISRQKPGRPGRA